jgi:hypothetical protein
MNRTELQKVILYRDPPGLGARPRRRAYQSLNFNERSAQYRAMMAHLRAHRYREGGKKGGSAATGLHSRWKALPAATRATLLGIGRQYELEVSNNFAREVVLFAIIGLVAFAWPLMHLVQAMLGR